MSFSKRTTHPHMYIVKAITPPLVLKNIPLGVNKRLSKISSNKEVFDKACKPYQEALRKSGYQHTLVYEPPMEESSRKRCRKRKVTWFCSIPGLRSSELDETWLNGLSQLSDEERILTAI